MLACICAARIIGNMPHACTAAVGGDAGGKAQLMSTDVIHAQLGEGRRKATDAIRRLCCTTEYETEDATTICGAGESHPFLPVPPGTLESHPSYRCPQAPSATSAVFSSYFCTPPSTRLRVSDFCPTLSHPTLLGTTRGCGSGCRARRSGALLCTWAAAYLSYFYKKNH